MPKQAEVAAIIYSDSCGYSIWTEDFNQIHIFVSYDANGLIDNYRVEYGDSPIYDGEIEVAFEDLYERAEEDWQETYRAELPGTVEYKRKQEAAELAAQAAASAGKRETWMSAAQQEQFRCICWPTGCRPPSIPWPLSCKKNSRFWVPSFPAGPPVFPPPSRT